MNKETIKDLYDYKKKGGELIYGRNHNKPLNLLCDVSKEIWDNIELIYEQTFPKHRK